MYSKKFTKAAVVAFAALFIILLGGAMTAAQAFSVDVDNLKYTDTSGPRAINYDFSSGTYGVSPLPPNSIGLPEVAISQRNVADMGFMFGVAPGVGSATLSAPTNGVGTFATSTEGAAILTGSSSPTAPPPAATASWTFSLALKNFAGVTDAAKRYRFQIGAALPPPPPGAPPAPAGPQPRLQGEWDSSGKLSLQAVVKDDDTGVVSFASTVVSLTGLTPTATSIELKIDNNTATAGKVVSSYSLDGGTTWTEIGTYTIPSGVVFSSLPARFPSLYIAEKLPSPALNLLQNGSFTGNLSGWIVNPALQTGTPPWTPLLADGSGVTMHPESYYFNGTILYQNLNLTGIAGEQVTLQARLWQLYSPPYQNTVAFYLTYLDTANALHRVKVYNPLNSSISLDPAASAVSASYTFDASASKLMKLEIVKEADGEFHLDDVVLSASAVTSGATPALSSLSSTNGAYGATLTISGSGFGMTAGKVTIGGVPVMVTAWSDTSITVTNVAPAHSGRVIVIADGVESNPSEFFTVASPCFNVELATYNAKVIKGQSAEFLFKSTFFNGFTTTGITLNLQNGDASTLSPIATFTPVPIKSGGGVVLKINTAGLAAKTYTADIIATNGAQSLKAGTLNLQVVTVSNIKFYEMIYDPVTYGSSRVDLTSKNVASQGQFYIYTEVVGSDDAIIHDDYYAGAGTGVVLTEVPASGAYPILGIYNRFWGYDTYAQANGTTALRATAPDGTSRDLPITVTFPTDSYITSIGLTAPTGTPSIYPIYNNRTDPITWYASGTTYIASIGYDTAGMMNFQIDLLDKEIYSSDHKSVTSTFNLLNLPTDIGTAIFHAQTSDGKATAVVPLTIVNASGTGLLSFYIRSLDPNAYAEMFKLYFYGASDNQLKFTKDVYAMHSGNKPVLVGNIPPGSYKVLFTPGSVSVRPQWWPNASDITGAATLAFAADATVGDIYFFADSQTTSVAVTLPTPATQAFATSLAGTGAIAFTAGDGYVWSAASGSSWITITSPPTGSGNGAVNYTVAANPYSASRTGTITIGGQRFTITQTGTGIVPVQVGTWGVQQLIHFDDGYNQVGTVAVPWYAEATRATFNEDGTGTMVTTKNDNNGEVKQQTQSFTYAAAANADGSMNMAITMTVNSLPVTDTVRIVISDNGAMAVVDGTAKDHQQKLMVLYRIDLTKTYSNADVSGQYYNVGFERNVTAVADPPLAGNGAFMAISGVQTFDGYGSYTYDAYANSVKIDGSNLIWHDDQTNVVRYYSVAADGTMTAGSGAFQGYFAGNGLTGGGGGAFVNGVNNQLAYFFIKKGDKSYTTADIAGRWALVSLGQDSKTTATPIADFYSSIGTMICDTAGNCAVKVKDRNSDNTTAIATDNLIVAIAADGSFGASFGGQSPAYAGAIGNNGNTVLMNPSLRYATDVDLWNREIIIGIRASNIGDLAGGAAVLKGDINGDGNVDLADAVLALKVMVGLNATIRPIYPFSGADVNGDGKVGAHELLYILQRLSGLRQ